jgi:hypothetical protein
VGYMMSSGAWIECSEFLDAGGMVGALLEVHPDMLMKTKKGRFQVPGVRCQEESPRSGVEGPPILTPNS